MPVLVQFIQSGTSQRIILSQHPCLDHLVEEGDCGGRSQLLLPNEIECSVKVAPDMFILLIIPHVHCTSQNLIMHASCIMLGCLDDAAKLGISHCKLLMRVLSNNFFKLLDILPFTTAMAALTNCSIAHCITILGL